MEDLRKLLVKNLEYTKEIHEMVKKIRRYIVFQQIYSVVKLVLIVIPIILAIVYALPLFKQAMGSYQQLMGTLGSTGGGTVGLTDLIKVMDPSSLPSGLSEESVKQFIR
jgi:hypothetical protein